MEQSRNEKTVGSGAMILLMLSAGFIGLTIIYFLTSPLLLNLRSEKPIILTILTSPPSIIKYYPAYGKVHMAAVSENIRFEATDRDKIIQVKNLLLKNNSQITAGGKFFIPSRRITPENFWENTKNYIQNGRTNPFLFFGYIQHYIKAYKNKKCNLNLPEFIALTLKLGHLKPLDFLIAFGQKGEDEYIFSDLNEISKPVLIRVFNASSIKGLARSATDYLRFLNGLGIIEADVVSYANWGKYLQKSSIITSSGRFIALSKIARELGLVSTEIIFKRKKMPFVDAYLILGSDVKLPELYDWDSKEMIH